MTTSALEALDWLEGWLLQYRTVTPIRFWEHAPEALEKIDVIRSTFPARPPVQWRPIESAPRNGSPVLLYAANLIDGNSCSGYVPHDLTVSVGWWQIASRLTSEGTWESTACDEGCQDSQGYSFQLAMELEPTHWMPLPFPPEASDGTI